MADIKINVKTEGAEESLNSIAGIKKSIKELRSQALAVGEGGKGFKQLTQQANELQDKLDDLKDSSKSLQGTGIEKLKSSFGLLTESFKNADFGKLKTALSGVGSAMKAIPIFLIIEGIMYLVENFEKLSQGSGFLAKALQFVGDVITKVTEGITWLLDKLGLVNAELDKQAENLTKNAEKGKAAIDKQNTAYDQQIAILKANGKSTIELEVAKQDAIIATNKALVQQTIDFVRNGGELTKAQQEILTGQLNAIKQASVDKEVILAQAETVSREKRKKHNEELDADKQKQYEKEADEWWAAQLAIQAANKKEDEDAAKAREKAKADAIQAAKDMAQALEIVQNHSVESRLNTLKVNYDIEVMAAKDNYAKLALLEAKYEEDKAKIIKDGADAQKKINDDAAKADEEALKKKVNAVNILTNAVTDGFMRMNTASGNLGAAITSNLLNAFNTLADKSASTTEKITSGLNAINGILSAISAYNTQQLEQDTMDRQAILDTQVTALNDARDLELEKEGTTAEQKKAINYKYAMQEYELKLQEYNKNTEVKKKAFEQDKKLKIAQTIISTITGVVSAVTGMISAVPGPVGIVLGALAGVAVAVMGAVQVAAISKQKFDAGTPPAAPKLTPPSADTSAIGGSNAQAGPELYRAGQGDINTGAGGPNGQRQGQPQKVYVVSQEVTSSQNMNAVLERRSSF